MAKPRKQFQERTEYEGADDVDRERRPRPVPPLGCGGMSPLPSTARPYRSASREHPHQGVHAQMQRPFVGIDGEFVVLVHMHATSLRYVTTVYNTIR